VATRIEPARPDDTPQVQRLLERNHLPLEGLLEHLATMLVARQGGEIVGSAALEVYPDGALLRSVAVSPDRQGTGLGRQLTDAAIQMARDRGLPALFLLTTTADRYFSKFGFERIERNEVPDGVKTSVEFTSACPASAIVMRKSLQAGTG
jgi:amino-acid N-acetyltransferase